MPQDLAPMLVPALFVLIVIAGLVGVVWSTLAERKRREALRQLAASMGLAFRERDTSVDDRYGFLDRLRQGSSRYGFNLLQGPYGERQVEVFDYHYETHSTDSKGRQQTQHHYLSVYTLEHELACPELRIQPESWLSRIGQALGFEDINFESVEFSRAFSVRGPDRKFAFDVCHTRMMEFLLDHRDLCIEIDHRCVAFYFSDTLKPEKVRSRLDLLLAFRALFPQYLYRT